MSLPLDLLTASRRIQTSLDVITKQRVGLCLLLYKTLRHSATLYCCPTPTLMANSTVYCRADENRRGDTMHNNPAEPPSRLSRPCKGQSGPCRWPGCPRPLTRTARALARLEQQPDQPHLAVCPSLYLADYRPLGAMRGDLPAPEAMTVRLPIGVSVPFSAAAVCARRLCIASESALRALVSIVSITVPCLSLLSPWHCKPSNSGMAAAAVSTISAYSVLLTQPVTNRVPVRQIEAGDSPAVPDVLQVAACWKPQVCALPCASGRTMRHASPTLPSGAQRLL